MVPGRRTRSGWSLTCSTRSRRPSKPFTAPTATRRTAGSTFALGYSEERTAERATVLERPAAEPTTAPAVQPTAAPAEPPAEGNGIGSGLWIVIGVAVVVIIVVVIVLPLRKRGRAYPETSQGWARALPSPTP